MDRRIWCIPLNYDVFYKMVVQDDYKQTLAKDLEHGLGFGSSYNYDFGSQSSSKLKALVLVVVVAIVLACLFPKSFVI